MPITTATRQARYRRAASPKEITMQLYPGQQGTTSGFPATVIRHYDGQMYEIRVPGGLVCIDAGDFIADPFDLLAREAAHMLGVAVINTSAPNKKRAGIIRVHEHQDAELLASALSASGVQAVALSHHHRHIVMVG